jgi:hypothetical protein
MPQLETKGIESPFAKKQWFTTAEKDEKTLKLVLPDMFTQLFDIGVLGSPG